MSAPTTREKILRAFPSEFLEDAEVIVERLQALNPSEDFGNGETKGIPFYYPEYVRDFVFRGQNLRTPDRLYFDVEDTRLMQDLSERQLKMMKCLFLRHHDGFVRERFLREIGDDLEPWMIPHVIQLLGEYVVEIIEVLDQIVASSNMHLFADFVDENPQYWATIQRKVVSYWNEYYRNKYWMFNDGIRLHKYVSLSDYLGTKLVKRINRYVKDRSE